MPECSEWVPAQVTSELDTRLENAFRRVSGSVGYDISFDSGRSRTMRETAAQMLDAGAESGGPLFMRMGRGLAEGRGLKLGPGISLRDMAGDILREFHNEGNTAFQGAKAALYADALSHMRGCHLDEEHCRAILHSAGEAFAPPSKDEFTRIAEPFCDQKLTPPVLAFIGAVAAFTLIIVFVRSPHLAVVGALLAGGLGFYSGRNRRRSAARRLLANLPRCLYDSLRSGLNANVNRYADIVNTALRALR